MLNSLPSILIALIWGGASLCTGLPFILLEGAPTGYRIAYLIAAPIIFVLAFATIAGSLARIGKKGIVAGKFPREAMHPVYLMRRIFNGCWTQLYYFKPVYAVILAVPILKKYVFRLFGYKHNTDFVVYPDTWLRDLPLLKVEKGAYLANRSTIGTNMCMTDGHIVVQGLSFGENAMVGHLSVLAPGGIFEKNCEVGTASACGIRVTMAESSRINPCTTLNHGSQVGKNSKIGTNGYVGLKAVVGDNISAPSGAFIPDGANIQTQDEMDELYSSETRKLTVAKDNVASILKRGMSVS